MASTEDSPIANKLKRIWFKTPIGEEQATQAVLDPVVGKLDLKSNNIFIFFFFATLKQVVILYRFSIASLEEERNSPSGNGSGNHGSSEKEPLSTKQRHQIKHRELFLSRQVETLPATHIRGKCSVTLLNETESMLSYLNKDVSSMKNRIPIFIIEFEIFLFYILVCFCWLILLICRIVVSLNPEIKSFFFFVFVYLQYF